MDKPGNIIDVVDAAIDEVLEEGGTLEEWRALSPAWQAVLVQDTVQSRVEDGYWFRWSDGTVRDWPEN